MMAGLCSNLQSSAVLYSFTLCVAVVRNEQNIYVFSSTASAQQSSDWRRKQKQQADVCGADDELYFF